MARPEARLHFTLRTIGGGALACDGDVVFPLDDHLWVQVTDIVALDASRGLAHTAQRYVPMCCAERRHQPPARRPPTLQAQVRRRQPRQTRRRRQTRGARVQLERHPHPVMSGPPALGRRELPLVTPRHPRPAALAERREALGTPTDARKCGAALTRFW